MVRPNLRIKLSNDLHHLPKQSIFTLLASQARCLRGGIGGIAPRFLFLPPDLFLSPTVFFLKSEHRPHS